MQTSNLNINELIHYLDITSTDPTVRRLVDLLLERELTLYDELVDAGMDPQSYTFYYDGSSHYSPGEYINELRQNVNYFEQEMNIAQEERDDAVREADKLKVRSVMQLMEEVYRERTIARETAYQANKEAAELRAKNAELEEKINVWKVMET